MIKQTRIHDLPETTYDEDYVLAVDNVVSGAGSISLKGVMGRAMEYIGETTVDMPEDPASTGYKMMMTRRFKDAVTDRDFVQIDIESPSAFTGSGASRNIDLPVILNLSAATITASAQTTTLSSVYFGSKIVPGDVITTNVALYPAFVTVPKNAAVRITGGVAKMEEIGGTLIYQGDPFAHTSHLSAWAFAGDQISVQLYDKAIQFYDAKMVQFQFKVKTDLVKTGNYGPMVVGFVGDDQFGLSSGFCTGADRAVLDPGGNYRNQEAYRNRTSGTSYRGNRGNEDFAFPEDFQWYSSSYTYAASISANSINFQYGRSFGLTPYSSMGSLSYPEKFQEHKSGTYTLNVMVNPSYVKYMYPYGSSLTSVKLTNMQTIRPVVGLLTGADNVSSPPKFKILESSLTIYACK